VTLIQPQYKGGALKGPARRESPKADVRLSASFDRNRPKADIRLRKVYRKVSLRFLPQMVHFTLTANIESVTLIQPQRKTKILT